MVIYLSWHSNIALKICLAYFIKIIYYVIDLFNNNIKTIFINGILKVKTIRRI